MRLVLALFSVAVIGIDDSFQKVYSDAEYLEDKCTIHSTDDYQTRVDIDHKKFYSKGMPPRKKIACDISDLQELLYSS